MEEARSLWNNILPEKDLYSCYRLRMNSVQQKFSKMAFSVCYCHKELLLRYSRHFGFASDSSTWQPGVGILLKNVYIVCWRCSLTYLSYGISQKVTFNLRCLKNRTLVEADPGPLSSAKIELFVTAMY